MKFFSLALFLFSFPLIILAQDSTSAMLNKSGATPKLGFFKLIVKDQDKVEKFYVESFGFEKVDHINLPTFEERVLKTPDGKIGLVLYSHKDDREITIGTAHGPVGLVTPEVDTYHKRALKNGGKEKLAPMDFGPVRLSFLFDPEGHEIELIDMQTSTPDNDKKVLTERWMERIESGNAYTSEEMMDDFLALDAISIEEILGMWKGGKFDGGKTPNLINWYGKKFISREHVEPLMIKTEDGAVVPFTKLGSAILREVYFGNKNSATIIYNNKPIMDYFRKIDDDTIIGWGEIKGETPDFFFWLKREKSEE